MYSLFYRVTNTDIRRVIYTVVEYSPLCDSSNMKMNDWMKIARDIEVRISLRPSFFFLIYLYNSNVFLGCL